MSRNFALMLGATLLLAAGCTPGEAAIPQRDADVSIDEIARNYQRLKRVTPAPYMVDPVISSLCRGVSLEMIEAEREERGVHAQTEVHIYLNEPAAQAWASKSESYPVGSVIVKEKWPAGQAGSQSGEPGQPQGAGGMVKRAPGFDPEHGDWEYFYFERPEKIEAGRLGNCIECHQRASDSDYVFGTWGAGA